MKKLIKHFKTSPCRIWYNEWVEKNARGSVLNVGKSEIWSYGFPTIDTNEKLSPTFVDDICDCKLDSNSYDVVLCNGMYESVEDPQKMVNEVMRITKRNGLAIFGFVNKNYYPYKKGWKYYTEGDIKFPIKIIKKKKFNDYVFIICKKF